MALSIGQSLILCRYLAWNVGRFMISSVSPLENMVEAAVKAMDMGMFAVKFLNGLRFRIAAALADVAVDVRTSLRT